MSRELQKKDLDLWWSDSDKGNTSDATNMDTSNDEPRTPKEVEYVFCSGGLFPSPIGPTSSTYQRKVELFKFLGSFIAKALLDNRLLDLPLSSAFIKWMLGQELGFEDFALIAPSQAKSLEKLRQVVFEKRAIERDLALTPDERTQRIQGLKVDGVPIEQLYLDFTLPGHPDWELKANGANISVNITNVEEYVNLVLRHLLVVGVQSQFRAFTEGFNQVFPLDNMQYFTVPEIETLICGDVSGSEADWSFDSLMDVIKADHGYSLDSQSVRFLAQIMSELTPPEKRKFLQFLTGSPLLPISGFKGLNPRFTIVKKHHDFPLSPNDYLPSVMSCTNYLKLPDYTSKEIMKQKLLYAILEGQSSFHLS